MYCSSRIILLRSTSMSSSDCVMRPTSAGSRFADPTTCVNKHKHKRKRKHSGPP
jgi:hypothetical protein